TVYVWRNHTVSFGALPGTFIASQPLSSRFASSAWATSPECIFHVPSGSWPSSVSRVITSCDSAGSFPATFATSAATRARSTSVCAEAGRAQNTAPNTQAMQRAGTIARNIFIFSSMAIPFPGNGKPSGHGEPQPAPRSDKNRPPRTLSSNRAPAPYNRPMPESQSPVNIDSLKALVRTVPDFPKPGILFYDITTLLKDKTGFAQMIDALAAHYLTQQIDLILGIEARGFTSAPALAYRLN